MVMEVRDETMNPWKRIAELNKALDLMVAQDAAMCDIYQVQDGITYLARRAMDRPCDRQVICR